MKAAIHFAGKLKKCANGSRKEIILDSPHLGEIDVLDNLKWFAVANAPSFPELQKDDPDWGDAFPELNDAKIPGCTLRIYATDEECNLETAMMAMDKTVYGGDFDIGVQWEGYSEYTIDDLWIDSAVIGGHDLVSELKPRAGKFLHIIAETEVGEPVKMDEFHLERTLSDALEIIIRAEMDKFLSMNKDKKFASLYLAPSMEQFYDHVLLNVLNRLDMSYAEYKWLLPD